MDNEIVFKDGGPETEESDPPTPITTCDMDVIIRGWEEKDCRLSPGGAAGIGEGEL